MEVAVPGVGQKQVPQAVSVRVLTLVPHSTVLVGTGEAMRAL